MNPVVHFEMPAEDKSRMAGFYSNVFGWETNQMGEEYGNYMVVMTDKSDQSGPLEKGRINGGFYEKGSDPKTNVVRLVVAVDDYKESMKKVEEAGGKIYGHPTDIPNVGMYVLFTDTEGNLMGMLQPAPQMGA